MEEDRRLQKPNLCRITTKVGGREFICINEVHDDENQKNFPFDARGNFVKAARHYFVRRYPYGGDH
jgi:hypothetical protein